MSQPPSLKSSTASSPGPRLPPKPRVILPTGNQSPHSLMQQYNNPLYISPGLGSNMQPMTPVNPYDNPFNMYPTKASEFIFNQFTGFRDFTMNMANSGLSVGEKCAFWMYNKVGAWSKKWFTHMFLFVVIFLYSLIGALIFVAVEGPNEQKQVTSIQRERQELVQRLWEISHQNYRSSYPSAPNQIWANRAVRNIREFEKQLLTSFKKGVSENDDGDKGEHKAAWSFWNSVFYCGTIYTTIGYGHITPSTTTGRAITIIYAIFGIPMFLILLADFGKLFTRGIKFIWAFVRRLYYTGSCRKVRKTETVQDVMKGVQMVYDIATFRRPSQADGLEEGQADVPSAATSQSPSKNYLNIEKGGTPGDQTPNTPAPSNFAVDDEFNLPVSVAILILVIYIFCGASIYWMWEDWGFFESFYFVFISMSTIGFGDFVPNHPMYMMASIIYLVFGLALTSMCINVVQVKLSDTFRQASAKIGATIGLRVAEDDGSITQTPAILVPPVEVAEVHTYVKHKDEKNKTDNNGEKESKAKSS